MKNYEILIVLCQMIHPMLWHRFCSKADRRINGEQKRTAKRTLFFFAVAFCVQIAMNQIFIHRLWMSCYNIIFLILYYVHALIAFQVDKRIILCCLVILNFCDMIIEYFYTFFLLYCFQFTTPEALNEVKWFRMLYIFIANSFAGLLLYLISQLKYNYLFAMKEKCVYQLCMAVFAVDSLVSVLFSMLEQNKAYQIFNPGTLFALIGELLCICIAIYMMLVMANRQMEQDVNMNCALTKIELLKKRQTSSEKAKMFLHDAKNHFSNIQYLLHSNQVDCAYDYVKQLVPELNDDWTGEKGENILSVLLYKKKIEAKHLGVDFHYLVNVEGVHLPIVDVATFIFNMCDNAIEYCSKHGLHSSGVWYRVFVLDSKLIFECYNKILKETKSFVKDFNSTSKEDREYHGYGLAILENCVGKYGGEVYIEQNCGLYIIQIQLSKHYAIEKAGEEVQKSMA